MKIEELEKKFTELVADQEMRIAALEEDLKTATDSLKNLDPMISGARVMAWRCSHSGMFFPSDYVKMWGIEFGVGLGKEAVSECLDSYYHLELPRSDLHNRGIKPYQMMYPVGITRAQIDYYMAHPNEFKSQRLVCHIQDENYEKRAGIIRKKQAQHIKKI